MTAPHRLAPRSHLLLDGSKGFRDALPIIALMLALGLCIAADAAIPPRLLGPRFLGDRLRIRFDGEPSTALRFETSGDLQQWVPWLVTNAPTGQLTVDDAAIGGVPRRFYRASASPIAPITLRLTSPAPGARFATDRPVLEVAISGVPASRHPPRFHANGVPLGCALELGEGLARCTPTDPLPAGFVLLTTTLPDTGLELPPMDRAEVLILPDARNLPPQARPDTVLVSGGESRLIRPLANDRDPNGDPLRLGNVGPAAHGTLRADGDGVVYTGTPGFSGTDLVPYVVEDGHGGTTPSVIRVVIRPAPALAAFVDDAPGGTLHGPAPNDAPIRETSLESALTNLCARLGPGERGRITVRARRPIPIQRLHLGCPVDILTEDGSPVRLEGNPLAIEVPVGGSLVGMTFGSSGPITLVAGGDVALIDNVFDADLQLVFPNPPPALHAHPPNPLATLLPPGDVVFSNNDFQNVFGKGTLPGQSALRLTDGDGLGLELDLTLKDSAGFEYDAAGFTERLAYRFHLEGTSRHTTRNVAGVRYLSQHIEGFGQHESVLETILAAQATVYWAGFGSLDARLETLRTDRLIFESRFKDLNLKSDHGIHGSASFVFDTPPGTQALVTWQDENLHVAGGLNLELSEETRLKLDARFLVSDGLLRIDARGELDARLSDQVRFGAGFHFRSRLRRTHLFVGDFDAWGSLFLEAGLGPVFVALSGGIAREGFAAVLSGGPLHRMEADGTRFPGGPGLTFDGTATVNLPFALHREPVPEPGTREPRHRQLAAPAAAPRVRLSNLGFSGRSTSSSGITLRGLEMPVEIVNCTFSNAMPGGIGLLLSEVDAAVTVRSNRFFGCVPTADGDLEGEGRTGRIRRPYVFENNQVDAPGNLIGMALQDLSDVTARRNRIVADRCLQVTSGQVVAEGNTFDASGIGGIAVVVDAGPNGPGALISRDNILRSASPILLGGGGFANFDGGNQFSGAGLLPFTSIAIGGSDAGAAYARFRGNTFGSIFFTVGPGGLADLTGNTFGGLASLTDANPRGGFISNPLQNTGVVPDLVSSQVDFNGDGCNDLPPRCSGRDERGDCRCANGVPPPSTPPWPLP